VTKKLPKALCAITGDHYSRKFLNARPDLFERSAVPLVLYGPDVLEGVSFPDDVAGSHIDLAPTFVELVAPAGFAYHAIGRDLFAPSSRQFGIGRNTVVTPRHVYRMNSATPTQRLPWLEAPPGEADVPTARRLHDSLHGIAWWRIMRGSALRGGAAGR
jgi:phosphoglycerol transferase MdoB-like AlkP superfamily enzyme